MIRIPKITRTAEEEAKNRAEFEARLEAERIAAAKEEAEREAACASAEKYLVLGKLWSKNGISRIYFDGMKVAAMLDPEHELSNSKRWMLKNDIEKGYLDVTTGKVVSPIQSLAAKIQKIVDEIK